MLQCKMCLIKMQRRAKTHLILVIELTCNIVNTEVVGKCKGWALLPDLPGKHVFPGKLYDYPGQYHYPRKNQKGCPTTLPESYTYPGKAQTC